MEPRLNVITLAVEDLERALTFYRDGLGFQSPGVIGSEWTDERTGANGAVALFELEGGLLLSLYPRSDLAKDAEIPVRGARSGEFSLGQLVQSRTDVDELQGKAEAAGATGVFSGLVVLPGTVRVTLITGVPADTAQYRATIAP